MKPWHTISYIGYTKDLSLSLQNQIILLNRFVAIFSIAAILRLILNIFDQNWTGVIIVTTMGILLSFTFIFQYFQKFNLAKSYFISIFLIFITAVNMLMGKEGGLEFTYFSIIVMIIIFFQSSFWKFFYATFTIVCYILSQYYFQNYDSPLAQALNNSTYHFLFFANLLCTVICALTFVQENKRFSLQTVNLLQEAEQQNSKLEEAQLNLEKQNKKLEGANKELEKFAYIASHDLKTPLRNINNFLNLIDRKIQQDSKSELQKYVKYASKSAAQMQFLIEDILEYSQLSGENFSLSDVNLNILLPTVKENISTYIEEKNAVLHFENLPIIQGHEGQLSLVFQNLIENGIKYNKSKTPTIKVFCEPDPDNFLLKIQDNGIGVNKEYFDRIFEMFTRLHNHEEYQGSGIGLSICQKILEYHGGKIQINSEEGRGTTFTISIPKVNAIPDFDLHDPALKNAAFELN